MMAEEGINGPYDVGVDHTRDEFGEGFDAPVYRNKVDYNWEDITEEFTEATSELKLGELLHDEIFGLFEAMSAIEMMDPKMDAGMMCNQIKRDVLNLEQSVEKGLVKIADLSYSEQIGIMDTTLACLVTWMEGHSLAQTVFTCLYLHNPYIIEDRCIKAFSILVLKLVDLIRDRVSKAGVFEEEDFQPMTYGFKLASDVTDLRVIGMMREVEEDLNRITKTTRSKVGEDRDVATQEQHELAMSVYCRVRFFRLLFSTLVAFGKEKCEGIVQAQKMLDQISELLPTMAHTVSLGIQPETKDLSKNDYPTIMGFEPLINQRLLPPTFPRYTTIRSRPDAVAYVETLVANLHIVCSLPDMASLHQILKVFLLFSQSAPGVLSRSLLQLTFLSSSPKFRNSTVDYYRPQSENPRVFGTLLIIDSMKETIRNFIAPPSLMQKSSLYNNPQAKEYVDAFLSHAVRPMCTLFQITGHNRARQRDKWAHLLEELANLQDEADKVDSFLHNLLSKTEPGRQHLACFGTWVLYHTLQVMIHYTLAGFELELYAVYEYAYVFWYLYEILYPWLVSSLTRADSFLVEQDNIAEHQQQKGRSNKKRKTKKKQRQSGPDLVMAQAMQQLCGGYYKAVIGFQRDGKLKRAMFDFDNEEVRYLHRFAPFVNVLFPAMVQYTQYKEMTDFTRSEPLPSDLYGFACKYFHQSKGLLESIQCPDEEVQNLLKIAKTNFVVMKLLIGGHKKGSDEAPEFDFNISKIFPVIKLV